MEELAPDAIVFGRPWLQVYPNEHPDARCGWCETVKPCVAWTACSVVCAGMSGAPMPPEIPPAGQAWRNRRR